MEMTPPIPTFFWKVICSTNHENSVILYHINYHTNHSCHPNLTKSLRLCLNMFEWPNPVLWVSKQQRRRNKDLESAQDGGDTLLQVVPSLVAFVNHLLQATGRIGAVLSGQATVLLVDQFQLRQALMNLSLESLRPQRSTSVRGSVKGSQQRHLASSCSDRERASSNKGLFPIIKAE